MPNYLEELEIWLAEAKAQMEINRSKLQKNCTIRKLWEWENMRKQA
jgi:hypothetical protein